MKVENRDCQVVKSFSRREKKFFTGANDGFSDLLSLGVIESALQSTQNHDLL
jgi:hypothetical protein